MTNEDVKKIRGAVKEEIEIALKPIDRKLDILWEQTEELTKDMDEVKETLNSHTHALKQIVNINEHTDDNVKRLDKRISETESHLGIAPPPELNII